MPHNFLRLATALKFITESSASMMAIKGIHSLCIEIFKSLDNLNVPYLKDLFERNVPVYSLRTASDLPVPKVNQTTSALRDIRCEGAVMRNHLPITLKC